ncbi:roadblock/LC7 domain-containing protein [Streptomyces sp. NPDC051940]|uniref:roadblock/LC7 domain-containing protein n=1 Tax=Streptomyces sp. NPDC051940 TaxID=3155675 RepID=UPI00344A7E14
MTVPVPVPRHGPEIAWILDPLLELPGVEHALIATGDGLPTAHSTSLTRADADRVAAMTAPLHAAARAVTTAFTGHEAPRPAQTVVESDLGFVIVTPAGTNTALAVFAAPGADLGTIAYRMQVQVAALARVMSTPDRRPGDGR